MNIKVIKDSISIEEAKIIGAEFYDDMVKGACDVTRGIIALGGEYHIDAAKVLIKNGSQGGVIRELIDMELRAINRPEKLHDEISGKNEMEENKK